MKCKRIGCKGYRPQCRDLFNDCRDRKVGVIGGAVELLQLAVIGIIVFIAAVIQLLFAERSKK